jgi:hypothetical protein
VKPWNAVPIVQLTEYSSNRVATGTAEACRKLGTSEQTYDRWRKEYGGLRVNHLTRLKAPELESGRLRTVVAD